MTIQGSGQTTVAKPDELRDYLIDLGEEMGRMALEAECPHASALLALATSELRKVTPG